MADRPSPKRAAVVEAARTVFGRDGYARSSIDDIAAEAGVSTRTIYNHFAGKEALFTSVLQASATEVADAYLVKTAALRAEGLDLVEELVALGKALIAQALDFPAHFAMVRQISAEAPHFPPSVLEAWRDAGPRRVEGDVAARLAALADDGLLTVTDPARAARHLVALVASEVTAETYHGAHPMPPTQVDLIVRAGVAAFLDGYRSR